MDFRLVPDETPAHVRSMVEGCLRDLGWTIVSDAPDENLRLRNLWDGNDTYAAMMGELNW